MKKTVLQVFPCWSNRAARVIDGESYSKKKKAKKKKKRLKDTQSHDDTLLSSLSALDMSHSEGTVTPGTAFSKPSKRKRRNSNRDAASTSDASVHASPAKAKQGRHLQDCEGSGRFECKIPIVCLVIALFYVNTICRLHSK